MTPEEVAEIVKWRSNGLSPKEIARKLGQRPAEVSRVLKLAAEIKDEVDPAPVEVQAFINEDAAKHLLDHRGKKDTEVSGLGMAIIAHHKRNKWSVASYLIDYYCLGVKDALGPRSIPDQGLEAFVEDAENMFPEGFRAVSWQQASQVVWGMVAYARSFGIEPHKDFRSAQALLAPEEGPCKIQFGKNGKPFYVPGPHDNPFKIVAVLESHLGAGNFDCLVELPSFKNRY